MMYRSLILGALVSCYSSTESTATNPTPAQCAAGSAPRLSNQDVFNRLGVSCKDCHGAGTSKPYFESLPAFEQGLVYAKGWVKKGDPGASQLLAVLRGQGTGSYKQMPISGPTYADLAQAGTGKISMAELEEWVQNLPAPGVAGPSEPVSGLHRVTAEQFLAQIDQTLGIAPGELADSATGMPKVERALPIEPPDSLGAWTREDYRESVSQITPRFVNLGGPHTLAGMRRVNSWTPTALQEVVQVSQARCRYAVEKQKPNLFKYAQPTDGSATAAAAIKKNIGQLYLRATGASASASEIDAVYTSLFVTYEKKSVAAAWTAVCAGIFRHPLAVSL
jgi:hypothetical protein